MQVHPTMYETYTVMGQYVISGQLFNEDGEFQGYLPIYPGFDPLRDFAATLRVINHYLSENNYAYIQEKNLIDSLENYLGKIQIRLEQSGRGNEISIWRSAFDDIMTRLRGEMN